MPLPEKKSFFKSLQLVFCFPTPAKGLPGYWEFVFCEKKGKTYYYVDHEINASKHEFYLQITNKEECFFTVEFELTDEYMSLGNGDNDQAIRINYLRFLPHVKI